MLITGILFLMACSYSKEYTSASDRRHQEKQFKDLFGFKPPAAVTEIKYMEVYNRYMTDGAWGRWISFTYDRDVVARILRETGYRSEHVFFERQPVTPAWFVPTDFAKDEMFIRDQDDTKIDEGFFFREYLWINTSSNMVYLYKYYSG